MEQASAGTSHLSVDTISWYRRALYPPPMTIERHIANTAETASESLDCWAVPMHHPWLTPPPHSPSICSGRPRLFEDKLVTGLLQPGMHILFRGTLCSDED